MSNIIIYFISDIQGGPKIGTIFVRINVAKY